MNVRAISMQNPLLTKELRSRMRGSKAYWVMFAYLTILSVALIIAYLSWLPRSGFSDESFAMGRMFLETLFYVQVGLVCLIAPGLTAGTVTIEKEQQTYDLLASTPMQARSIILGKLFSALSFVLLLVVSSLPLVSACFLLGGVSPGEVFFAYLVLILTAFMYGSIGIMWSTMARNTATSTVATYGTVLAVFVGTLPFVFTGQSGDGALQALNPIGALMNAVSAEKYFAFTMPAWIPSLILNGLAGILFSMVSVRKVDSHSPDTSVGMRVVSLALSASAAILVFGWIFGRYDAAESNGVWEGITLPIWLTILTVLMVISPIFTTGEPVSGANGGLMGFLLRGWRRVFRSELSSGWPFVVVLLLVATALFMAGFPMMKMAFYSGLRFELPVILALVFVVLAVYNIMAVLLSHVLKSRWSALISTYLVMAVCTCLPLFTLMDGRPIKDVPHRLLELSLYLNPQIALLWISGPIPEGVLDPYKWGYPFHSITTFVYAVVAIVLAACLRWTLVRRR